jgi:hypothetical protein
MFGQRVILKRYYRKNGSRSGFEALIFGNSKTIQRVVDRACTPRSEIAEENQRARISNQRSQARSPRESAEFAVLYSRTIAGERVPGVRPSGEN